MTLPVRRNPVSRVQSSSDAVPVHCEAYPCLPISSVYARWHEGRRFCEWSDEYGGLSAQADIRACTVSECLILYSCGEQTYHDQRGMSFPVSMCRQPSGRTAPRIRCVGCGLLTDRIYWRAGRWACQRCQKLVMRRSLLDPKQKLILKREQLTHSVHAPAKPLRSVAAYDRMRAQLIRVRHELGDDIPQRLGAPLQHVLSAFWFSQEEDRSDREELNDAPAYLDMTVDELAG